jgi:alginate production protein
MSKASRTLAFLAALSATQSAVTAEAPVAGWQSDLRLGLGYFGEGERDLGLGDAQDTHEGFADVQGTLYWNDGRDWAALARAQLFAPTSEITVTDEDQPRRSETYARLRELWFEYNGFTSYPGEVLRVGLQRLRDEDGLWFDTNIESVRWIYDTTLLQGHIGVAESFYTYRSDDSDPVANIRDRAYLFGGLGTQWAAGHFIGARAIHATDHGVDFEEELIDEDSARDPKRSERDLTWLDIYVHNGYYQRRETPGWSYWADASLLFGTREDYTPATLVDPASTQETDVRAWAGELGLRYRLQSTVPVQLGAAYAIGSGSEDGDREHRYEQTGLHSNRSRFTGTRTQAYRFNGAYQADLTNLQATSGYISFPGERWDAALVYTHFARHRAGEPVVTDGIGVQPQNPEKNLGDGLDLVLGYYFGNPVGAGKASVSAPQEDDNTRSNIRLRASAFDPGDAYADGANEQYAVRAELTLWF